MEPANTIAAQGNSPAAPPPGSPYRPIKIGPRLEVWPPVVLAPMAGVTSYPYRKICRDFGAGLCITEMVSSRALVEQHHRTQEIAEFGPEESPRSIQIFGADPQVMSDAVRQLKERDEIDHIDINFGCPAPKVVRKGCGAAIPAKPDLCRAVVRATVKAAGSTPVSVKLRLGLDEDRFTFRDAARIAEEEGCAYVGLHARTMAQFYTGTARWQYIRELKERVKIPVLGNGDVFTAARCKEMFEATGCDGVIIGRGCLGNPWLFQELKAMFDGAPAPPPPTLDEVLEIIRLHYRLLRGHFSLPKVADMMIRKFGTWYVRGLRHAAGIRRQFQEINGPDDVERVLEEMARAGWQEGFRPFEPRAAEPAVGECGS